MGGVRWSWVGRVNLAGWDDMYTPALRAEWWAGQLPQLRVVGMQQGWLLHMISLWIIYEYTNDSESKVCSWKDLTARYNFRPTMRSQVRSLLPSTTTIELKHTVQVALHAIAWSGQFLQPRTSVALNVVLLHQGVPTVHMQSHKPWLWRWTCNKFCIRILSLEDRLLQILASHILSL